MASAATADTMSLTLWRCHFTCSSACVQAAAEAHSRTVPGVLTMQTATIKQNLAMQSILGKQGWQVGRDSPAQKGISKPAQAESRVGIRRARGPLASAVIAFACCRFLLKGSTLKVYVLRPQVQERRRRRCGRRAKK